MQDRTPPAELHRLLTAVLDALTLPYETPDYDRRIGERAATARVIAREALAEDPANLGWNTDYLRSRLRVEQADADQRAADAAAADALSRCGRCRTPFDPADTRHDGHAQHADTPFCRRCTDRCHESSDAFHVCPVCRGGEGQ